VWVPFAGAPGIVVGGSSPSISGSPVYVPVDLAPGKYGMICFLSDGKDGKPHFTHRMIKTVDIA
jgi:hypothetical protein